MNRIINCIVILLLLSQTVFSQSKRTVAGEYRMMVPSYMNRVEARLVAIEQAKIDALAKEFGTIVSQTNLTVMEKANNQSSDSFYSLGMCDVKGEWLKDLKEPVVTEAIVDGQLWMIVEVKGVARELKSAKINIESHLLRNGKEDKYESDDYRSGDVFYMSFRSPTKGYLAIYLLDADRNAFPIVPSSNEEEFPIKRGERYVFVDNEQNHLILTTEKPQELNQVYVIFSPNKFYPENVVNSKKNPDLDKYLTEEYKTVTPLPYVPYKKFQKWLNELRLRDTEMQVVTKVLTIKSNE